VSPRRADSRRVRADLGDGHLTVVLGPDGHLHPKVEEPGGEPAAEVRPQHPPVDPEDPVVAFNRERLEELRHEPRRAPVDIGDVVETREGRFAAAGIALGLVARAFAFAMGAATGWLVFLAGLLAFAVYKVPMWVGERVLRLFDRR
jgi:hypothetical protein